MDAAFLADMSRIAIGGPDAEDFLQNLITADLENLEVGKAAPGALLTPQGKIMFFFMISREGDGFSIEIETAQADAFVKRLTMYRLRAKVDIGTPEVGGTTVSAAQAEGAVADLRFEKAGIALYRKPGGAGERDAYDALRAEVGIAEAGFDFTLGDAFPHDIMLERTAGVSFKKGCYVGQEVVSRMQHRSTARRRVVLVSADLPLPPSGTEIVAGGKVCGTLGTVSWMRGLAIARIDRIGAAMAAGDVVMAGDLQVRVELPSWSGIEFPVNSSEE